MQPATLLILGSLLAIAAATSTSSSETTAAPSGTTTIQVLSSPPTHCLDENGQPRGNGEKWIAKEHFHMECTVEALGWHTSVTGCRVNGTDVSLNAEADVPPFKVNCDKTEDGAKFKGVYIKTTQQQPQQKQQIN